MFSCENSLKVDEYAPKVNGKHPDIQTPDKVFLGMPHLCSEVCAKFLVQSRVVEN